MNFFNEFNPSEFDKLFDNKYCFFKDRERSCYVVLIFASLLDISLKHKMKQHRYKFIEKIWHKKRKGIILWLYSN